MFASRLPGELVGMFVLVSRLDLSLKIVRTRRKVSLGIADRRNLG